MALELNKAIICRVGSEEYALDVTQVLSIERFQDIRPIPNAESYMAGIMDLRGTAIPVLDLRIWLAIKDVQHQNDDQKRIVVTESGGKKLGLVVDAATEVLDIPKESVQAVEMHHGAREVSHVANLNDRLILILDVSILMEQLDFSILETTEAV